MGLGQNTRRRRQKYGKADDQNKVKQLFVKNNFCYIFFYCLGVTGRLNQYNITEESNDEGVNGNYRVGGFSIIGGAAA